MFKRSVPNLVLNEALIEKDSLSTLQMILVKYCNVLGVKSQGKTALWIRERWKTQLQNGDQPHRQLESLSEPLLEPSADPLVPPLADGLDGSPHLLSDVISLNRMGDSIVIGHCTRTFHSVEANEGNIKTSARHEKKHSSKVRPTLLPVLMRNGIFAAQSSDSFNRCSSVICFVGDSDGTVGRVEAPHDCAAT